MDLAQKRFKGDFPMRNYVLTLMAMLVFAVVSTAGQSAKGTWTPPRTPDGQPDIQGVWTNNTVTPLQRPKELGAKEFYSEAELAEIQKQQRDRLHRDYDEGEGQAKTNHTGIPGNPPDDVHSNFAQGIAGYACVVRLRLTLT